MSLYNYAFPHRLFLDRTDYKRQVSNADIEKKISTVKEKRQDQITELINHVLAELIEAEIIPTQTDT